MAKRFEKAKEYTEKYKNKLLPCKYCGSNDIRITSEREIFGKNKNMWAVSCTTRACDCTGTYNKVFDEVIAWNNKQKEKKMIIQNREEFDKEMARRGWNGYAYITEVEQSSRDNGHYGTEDISYKNPAHEGGYLDNFDLVKPNNYVIVNENTNEEKTILSTEFKGYGDEWYIDEENDDAVYKFRK